MTDHELMNEVKTHIKNGDNLYAMKMLIDHKKIGLKDAKDFVKALAMGTAMEFSDLEAIINKNGGQQSFSSKEKGSILTNKNVSKALYTDPNGTKHELTPDHELWPQFKVFMGPNNRAVNEFEAQYFGKTGEVTNQIKPAKKSTLFIEENKGTNTIVLIIIAAAIAFGIWYYVANASS